MRALGLDVGDRRIGVAVAEVLARPLFTIHRKNERADRKAVLRFMRQHGAEVLVVGLPLEGDGSEGPQAAKVRAFVDGLEGVAVEWVDERLTTRLAHELLNEAGYRSRFEGREARLERSEVVDQMAAVLILEAWMERREGVTLLPGDGADFR